MIYSIFDAIYDTYSTAIFHPPAERRAAWQLRHLDHEATARQKPSGSGRRARRNHGQDLVSGRINRSS